MNVSRFIKDLFAEEVRLQFLIGVSLLLAFSLVLGSYFVIYHHDYEIEMADLEVHSKDYKGGVLTVTVSTTLDGEFLYRVTGAENEDGNYELTFHGGKQPSLAQTPGDKKAVLTVEIPDGYEKVVCGKTTLYTFS